MSTRKKRKKPKPLPTGFSTCSVADYRGIHNLYEPTRRSFGTCSVASYSVVRVFVCPFVPCYYSLLLFFLFNGRRENKILSKKETGSPLCSSYCADIGSSRVLGVSPFFSNNNRSRRRCGIKFVIHFYHYTVTEGNTCIFPHCSSK